MPTIQNHSDHHTCPFKKAANQTADSSTTASNKPDETYDTNKETINPSFTVSPSVRPFGNQIPDVKPASNQKPDIEPDRNERPNSSGHQGVKKGILTILVGIPGSGKSTAAKNVGKVISSDDIRKELFGDASLQYEEKAVRKWLQSTKGTAKWEPLSRKQLEKYGNEMVFAVMDKRIHKALTQGESVVYDATSLTPALRKNIIQKFSADCSEINALYLNTDLSVALKRNQQRERKVPESIIRAMHSSLIPPTKEEGFTHITEITAKDD